MAIVYRHIRLDKNIPFYIGIGKNYKRAYTKYNRNKVWNRIILKTDYEVEILFDNLTWEKACEKEIEFIKLYGRLDLKNGILSNQTDGGDGNHNFSEETKKRISIANKGNQYGKGWKPTDEQRKKMSEGLKGKQNKSKTKFTKGMTPWNKGIKGLVKPNKGSFSKENFPKAVSVIDITTDKIYKTIREAAIELKLNEKSLYSMLTGRYKNKTNLRYANI
jgi:hypothetical protein